MRLQVNEGSLGVIWHDTGLLDRQSDVPACVVEGLAMYGDVRLLKRRGVTFSSQSTSSS